MKTSPPVLHPSSSLRRAPVSVDLHAPACRALRVPHLRDLPSGCPRRLGALPGPNFRHAPNLRGAIALAFILLAFLLLASVPVQAAETENPIVVWDINFNADALDAPPPLLTAEQIKADPTLADWDHLPIRACTAIQFGAEARRATVVQEVAGLKDKPLLLEYEQSDYYGPRVAINVPFEIAKTGLVWTLSFDAAKGNLATSGGIIFGDLGGIFFLKDGTVRVRMQGEEPGNRGKEVARYLPDEPLHFECRIDFEERTLTITVNGDKGNAITSPFPESPAGRFLRDFSLNGMMPGGYGAAPSNMVFDNIKLVMERGL